MNQNLQQQSTELTIQQRCAIALKADIRRAQFTELAEKSTHIVEITNAAGRQECHAAAMRLAKARIEVESEGEAVRSDAVKFQKGVIVLQKELIAIIAPEEERLKAIRDAHDAKLEAIRNAAAQAELDRIAAEQLAIKQAEEARMAAERAEIARRQAELDVAEKSRIAMPGGRARKRTASPGRPGL